MTFWKGLRVSDRLVALADTQIVRGQEMSSKAKLSLLDHGGSRIFLMTSGLRSIRDKAVMRLEDELAARERPHDRLYRVVTKAVALAYLAFDSTRASVDVEFPIDLVLLGAADGELRHHRFSAEGLSIARGFWQQQLQNALDQFPMAWAKPIWPTSKETR